MTRGCARVAARLERDFVRVFVGPIGAISARDRGGNVFGWLGGVANRRDGKKEGGLGEGKKKRKREREKKKSNVLLGFFKT